MSNPTYLADDTVTLTALQIEIVEQTMDLKTREHFDRWLINSVDARDRQSAANAIVAALAADADLITNGRSWLEIAAIGGDSIASRGGRFTKDGRYDDVFASWVGGKLLDARQRPRRR